MNNKIIIANVPFRVLESYANNEKFIKIFLKNIDQESLNRDQYTNIFDIFRHIRNLHYPESDIEFALDSNWITKWKVQDKYGKNQLFKYRISIFKLNTLEEKRIIRTDNQNRVYKYDIKLYIILIDSFKKFKKLELQKELKRL